MLYLFYAVTLTSIYEVKAQDKDGYPSATKIALRGESQLKVGEKLEKSVMISVGRQLQAFVPEGHSMLSPLTTVVRQLENVNTMWWGGGTSSIVALFKTKKSAFACFKHEDSKPYDPRWKRATKGVLVAIGEKHPVFSITYWGDLGAPREFAPARA